MALKRKASESILQTEERAFPRGGASVLTPLEHKQIKLEAERDVLFEQSGQNKANKSEEYGDDEGDAAGGDGAQVKRRRKSKGKKDPKADNGLPHVKIQGLSYKNLVVGSMVLGQVTHISSRDVALALPNNLTGYVPVTAISERINGKIEALLAQADEEEKEEVSDDDDDDDDIDLKSLFHIGQYLRACVTSTAEEPSVKGPRKSRKRIELSIDPRQANTGLAASEVVLHSVVQAAVRSVEDHGLIMDLGLDDQSVKGFVSKKELGKDWDMSKIHDGQVMLCLVTGLGSNGKVVKLSPDTQRIGDINKQFLSEAPTVDAFLPGIAVELLITEANAGGVTGKIMGLLDATADIVHSGSGGRVQDVGEKYKLGSKVKARIICTFPSAEEKKVGVSLLEHIKTLQTALPSKGKNAASLQPSHIVEDAKVVQVEPAMGLFLKLGGTDNPAFAHISRISDEKIETLSSTTGQYKLGSSHRARILAFNTIDGVYNVSLEKKVLDQPFLRIEDVQVGQLVKGTVEKLILGAKGITGVIVTLADGVDALVPEMHLSDVRLQHPEKKFREGFPVNARVLSVDLEKNQIRLTLKKTLVNSDVAIWKSYDQIAEGDKALGSIINLKPTGAVVQFYGEVRAWLPVAEISEAYISDPAQHFRLGQTVNVHAKTVNAEAQELKVSCKDASAASRAEDSTWQELEEGQLVAGTVTEASAENVMLELDVSKIKATLRLLQLSDGSEQKARSLLKQIRVGQKLSDLVVLEKLDKRHLVVLSNKSSLAKAAKAKTLVASFHQIREGQEVNGFIRNITPDGIFVEFAAGIVGFLPKTQITLDKLSQPAFGMRKDQSISARVLSVSTSQQRFVLTLREQDKKETEKIKPTISDVVTNPVDGVSTSMADFTLGKQTQARIVSVKETQLNVQLADNLQGRIDVSEVFDSWDDIKDRKRPLQKFKPKQIIPVKILGIHDARNHRFLPISHRQSRVPVFELTAKDKTQLNSEADVLTLDQVKVDSNWIAYVNNVADRCVWANISPNVRGRIDFLDLSDDVSLLQNMSQNFPVGSALRVRVKNVNPSVNHLDLTATSATSGPADIKSLTVGTILPGKITKVSERALTVQLSHTVSGIVILTEMADDYTQANPTQHNKQDIVRVCVASIDIPNKRVFLTMRPSKVLSSALPVEDRQITSISQLAVNDVTRGFVKAVTDKGVVVSLGPRVDAFVRISDLSDKFIKDWKSAVEIDQLVKGKILAVDASLNHVQISLKQSHVDKNYIPPNSFGELKVGEIVTGKVRKVEEFGVFIDVDNTVPRVSGLCHRSQIADSKIEDARKLYEEGDAVKAKILSIDSEKRRISFGLKASFFKDIESDDEMQDADDSADEDGVALDGELSEEDDEGGIDIDLSNVEDIPSDEDDSSEMSVDEDDASARKPVSGGLTTSGFDWTGTAPLTSTSADVETDTETATAPKKHKRKPRITEDRTGDLDAHGPQSVADFERVLLTSPSDSSLWIQYMAFQLRLSEVQKARDIGQRALRTIHLREQDEKQNVWIALLNLEVSYGTPESVESTFRDACGVQDSLTMHEKLATIYVSAGDFPAAEKIFDAMVATKAFRPAGSMWINYATFLFEKLAAPARARALLSRAVQSVPSNEHRLLTAKFAALEFHCEGGDPERGRTVFEGLLAEWPKWTQGWDMWVDLEKARGDNATQVRALFERMSGVKMKKRRAKFVFKRWLEFEEGLGEKNSQAERVKALAATYVEALRGEE